MQTVCEPPRGRGRTAEIPSADESGWNSSVGIVAVAAGLMAIGAVVTFSVGSGDSLEEQPLRWWAFWEHGALRQLPFVAGGLTAVLIMTRLPYRIWAAGRGLAALGLLMGSLLLAALVFIPGVGKEINNARRWVQFGPQHWGLQLQPSELIKVALPIFLATWATVTRDVRNFRRGLLPAVVLIGVCVLGVGLEDFGTGVLLAAVGGAMLLAAGARWSHLLLLALPAPPMFWYLLTSRAHRLERLLTFQNIWADPQGSGYQAVQSLCTIASGGWSGRGLGCGLVKGYLPEARNDFIFAVICEEWGVIGAAGVIGLLIALMWQAHAVFRRCPDPMGRLLALGIALTIGLQAVMNIAVVTVSVPTKGISLPLVSAGGSGVVLLGSLVGVLASIPRAAPAVPAAWVGGRH